MTYSHHHIAYLEGRRQKLEGKNWLGNIETARAGQLSKV
jgi:hypothetical protein